MLSQKDFQIPRLVSLHLLILSSYISVINALFVTAKYTSIGVFYYFSIYFLANIFNHLAFYAKLGGYPTEAIKVYQCKRKAVKWVLYFALLVPISFPPFVVIHSMSYVIYMFEK